MRHELAARPLIHVQLSAGPSLIPPPLDVSHLSTRQREDVKAAFHASAHDGAWVECSGTVGGNFWTQKSPPAGKLLPDLLKKIRACALGVFCGKDLNKRVQPFCSSLATRT
jgi:hypothetical protein